MRRSLLLASLILGGLYPALSATPGELDKLVEELKTVALARPAGTGIAPAEIEVAKRVLDLKGEAVPALLALLQDPNRGVRDLAAFTLSDREGLKEEHLDVLIEACRRDDGWHPGAIARIGTPRAVKFLIDGLVRKRKTYNQYTGAMEVLGAQVVPNLTAIYEREEGWDGDLEETLEHVWRELGPKAAGAVEPLMKLAVDQSARLAKRVRALKAVGALGPVAEGATERLQALRMDADAGLQSAATHALLCLRGEASVPILIERLEKAPLEEKTSALGDIAFLGAKGRVAGPAVLKLLSSKEWALRESAAYTLGCIGHAEAAGDLRAQLGSVENWRLVYRAVEALGRLQAQSAIPDLEQLASSHWFPPVCELAQSAATSIRDGHPFLPPPRAITRATRSISRNGTKSGHLAPMSEC